MHGVGVNMARSSALATRLSHCFSITGVPNSAYLIGYLSGATAIAWLIAFVLGVIVDFLVRSSTSDVGPSEEANIKGKNFVVRHWRGELKLWVSYWVIAFIGNILAAVLIKSIGAILKVDDGYNPLNIFATLSLAWVCALVISAWQTVGVWRWAIQLVNKRKRTNRSPAWGALAQISCVLSVLELDSRRS